MHAAPSPPPFGSPILLILLLLAVVQAVPFWFICKKAGMSPWLCLIAIIPLGALVLSYVLAFGEWPALRRDVPPRI